jgi:hypothetical protein
MSKTRIEIIPIEKLVVSEANVRKHGIDPDRLKPSIEKEGGILEPIHVWYNSEKDVYEIMQGQHRYLGAKAAGITELECVVHLDIKTLADAKQWCRKQACLQEDLDPLDKLQIALDLKKQYGSLRKGCHEERLPYSKLSDWYSLKDLSPEVMEIISNKISDSPKLDLPLRKLKEVARLPKEEQLQVARKIEGLNDVQTRRVLREIKSEADSMPVLIDLSYKAYSVLKERAERDNFRLEQYCSKILEESA